jgi:hypothetical protein
MEKRATFSVSGEVGSVFGELMLGGRHGDAGTRRARRRSSHPFRGPPGNAHAL